MNELLKSVKIVEAPETPSEKGGAAYTVSVVEGEPVALNGVAPVLTIRLTDPDRDLPRLILAAEALLPFHREAPGVVALNEAGEVLGVITREDLEEAVILRRWGKYTELTRTLGLERGFREPDGDPAAPFVYWTCRMCDSIRIPNAGHQNDAPPLCRRHDPPRQMERRTHPGY